MLRYHLGRDEILDRYTFEEVRLLLAASEREERQRVAVLVQAIHTGEPQKLFDAMMHEEPKAPPTPPAPQQRRAAWASGVQRLAGLTVSDAAERERIQQKVALYDRAAQLLESRKSDG